MVYIVLALQMDICIVCTLCVLHKSLHFRCNSQELMESRAQHTPQIAGIVRFSTAPLVVLRECSQ